MYKYIDKRIIIKIKDILFKYIKDKSYRFFIYGSRVTGNITKFSDYDIGVIGENKLDIVIFLEILEEFEKVPALIDFTDFCTVSEDFKKEAMKNIIYLN